MDAVQGDWHAERASPAIEQQKFAPSRYSTIPMRLVVNVGSTLGKVLWIAGLVLTLALSAGARGRSENISNGQAQACVNAIVAEHFSIPVATESPTLADRRKVTEYVMDFDGDHSLDLATVVEQVVGAYSHYTVQLHLASGAEQSIALTAPPGGFRLEMHDMTGDKVPNDLVLRPALVHWLPTVLVNDGHDHFAVVISNHSPDSLSSGQDLESRGSDAPGTAALMPSGFKAGNLSRGRELFPQLRELLLSPTTQAVFPRREHTTSSGRAPPALAILI
jgi:hypothetical protein